MNDPDIFSVNLTELKKLFPQLKTDDIIKIKKLFNDSEAYWNTNLSRLNKIEIKYLLICEAPPSSGNYFYKNAGDYLFKQVWKCFFGNQPICTNPNNAYQCLANIGFLLIDTLQYPVTYKKLRKKPAYLNLIQSYHPIWVNKLNTNFTFSSDLRIAFGFKLNSHAVISASGGSVTLGGIPRPLTPNLIAATGAGQPSSTILPQKFRINWGTSVCKTCP